MRWLLVISTLLLLTGCASFRARMWAKGSDWADELDGTDDVPSVEFGESENQKPEMNDEDQAQ